MSDKLAKTGTKCEEKLVWLLCHILHNSPICVECNVLCVSCVMCWVYHVLSVMCCVSCVECNVLCVSCVMCDVLCVSCVECNVLCAGRVNRPIKLPSHRWSE